MSDSGVLGLAQGLDGHDLDLDPDPDPETGLDPSSHHLCDVFLRIAGFLLELVSVSL